jgi:hypothetical protein
VMNEVRLMEPGLPAHVPQPSMPLQLIQLAMEKNQLDQMDKLLDLQQRWEANEARKAYVAAMARCKAEPILVQKDKKVSIVSRDGKQGPSYTHATLASVVDAVVARMGRFGLSHRWDVKQSEGAVTVSCVITHELGHSEMVTLSGPRDDSGSKNLIQQIGSTITYLQRYTLMSAFGLAARDMDDDDGKSAGTPPNSVTADQATELRDLAKEANADTTKFLAWMQCESFDSMPASLYQKAKQALLDKKAGKQ